MTNIVFGIGTETRVDAVDHLLETAELADRHGLDLLSVSDHAYLGEYLDAYAAVGFVLGRTQRLGAFVNVTNVPTRPAPMLARTITSLSALSKGRTVLGVGAGGRLNRIADLGFERLEPAQAVEAFEEAIVLVRRLTGGGPPVTHVGKHYRVNEITPAEVEAPQVWTGSNGPKSLAATGRVADGWIPGHAADWLSERYRTSRPIIDQAAIEAGRRPEDIRTVYNVPGRITERPSANTRDETGRWIGGSVDQWIEELTGAVLNHGARGFILFPPDDENHTQLRLWAQKVVPAVRENIAQV